MMFNKDYKRIIPLEELRESYDHLADLAAIFNHDVIEDNRGRWRWQANGFACYLISDHAPFGGGNRRDRLDLNRLMVDMIEGKFFTVEEYTKFHMQIGYSLGGFLEIFDSREAAEWNLPGAKKPESEDEYTQTVLDYLLEKHKGQVLKL